MACGLDSARQLVESNELRMLAELLLWGGLPIAACAFVLGISAMWAGMVRPGDFDYVNIGGLVPFRDGHDHLASAFDQARDGIWNRCALRRPLAAAVQISSAFSQSIFISTDADSAGLFAGRSRMVGILRRHEMARGMGRR